MKNAFSRVLREPNNVSLIHRVSGSGDMLPCPSLCLLLCTCLQSGTDAWRPMKNAFGAAWEASRLPALPWDIRLTNAAGKSLLLP